jgi:hypothetical protein
VEPRSDVACRFAVNAMKARNSGSGSEYDAFNNQSNGHDNMGHGTGRMHGNDGGGSRVHRNAPSYTHNQYHAPYAYQPMDPMLRQPSSSPSLPPPPQPLHQTQHIPPSLMFTTSADTSQSNDYPTPSGSSMPINGATTPGRHMSSFAFSPSTFKMQGEFSWLDSILEGNGNNQNGGGDFLGDSSSLFTTQYPSEQAHLLSLESPEHLLASAGLGSAAGLAGIHNIHGTMRREPQLEDVTSWANISHYISLFLQYLYPLLPLVHRPTFAEHLATRRDLRDTDFRALLLSIGESVTGASDRSDTVVTYVISQLPTSRLVNDQFDIEGLKHLQRRCHRTCKVLQRTYYGPTNLVQVTTIVL